MTKREQRKQSDRKQSDREWSDIVSIDPHAIISLSRVALFVNEFFHLSTNDSIELIKFDTPYVWWGRSKSNHGISHPMPKPVAYVSGWEGGANDSRARGPLWHQEQIIHWYGQWKDLEVKECVEAGDGVSSRGHRVPSQYREVG